MTIIKMTSPIKVWIPEEDEEIILSDNDAACCLEFILAAIKKDEDGDRDMLLRGLMGYYRKNDSLNRKVLCARPSVELDEKRRLVGVCKCCIREPLTDEEMDALKAYISGQYSDGWGEGFGQNCIATEFGGVYVSFWYRSDDWKLSVYDPQKELEDISRQFKEVIHRLEKYNEERQDKRGE